MVKLPAGWKKQATDHSMWSKLLDESGAVVASIFYKAAFYDRIAEMNCAPYCRRYAWPWTSRAFFAIPYGAFVSSG